MQRVQEAIAFSLEDDESASVPQLEFIGVQRVSVPA
jgi:predicted RNase H-like HicB family nuclease